MWRCAGPNWQPPPPSFHQERIRQMPDGQLFATISRGVRTMPSYAAQIPTNDRWAIVNHVRAIQGQGGEADSATAAPAAGAPPAATPAAGGTR